MYVRRLQLSNFRNYASLDLSPPTGNLLFLGDNAQGKSNLLEAVYLLAAARSPRAGSDTELVGWQAEALPQAVARVSAVVERRAGSVQLETAIIAPAPGLAGESMRGGKRLKVNGIPRRAIDLVGQLRAVLFRAEDMEIVAGAPAERRRYLDAMLSQLDRLYYAALSRYARVLQQRNAALRRLKEGAGAPEELTFWDDTLAREGAVIVTARLKACARLADLAAEAHRRLSGDAAEDLTLEYQPRLGGEWERLLAPDADQGEVQRLLAAAIVGQRRREVAAGLSLVGPHRDDLLIKLNGVAAAAFGSRAQVRTATLALRLAEARLLAESIDDPPLLLLDDIVSELDERRRRSVLESIGQFDQVWFTATDDSGLPPAFVSNARAYRVESGTLAPA